MRTNWSPAFRDLLHAAGQEVLRNENTEPSPIIDGALHVQKDISDDGSQILTALYPEGGLKCAFPDVSFTMMGKLIISAVDPSTGSTIYTINMLTDDGRIHQFRTSGGSGPEPRQGFLSEDEIIALRDEVATILC